MLGFWLSPWGWEASGAVEWPVYGGNSAGTRYSPLKQVHRGNVHRLRQAWIYDSGDAFPGSEMQCNPLVRGGVLYATTPRLRVVALDAANGRLLWSFNPFEGREVRQKMRNRGLMYWSDGKEGRIYFAAQNWLYALDARTGRPIADFGQQGRVDLKQGLGRDLSNVTVGLTTPGVVWRDLLIIGSITSEDLPAAPGDIRAYDARTGALRWSFHTIPHPGEFGYDTWPPDAWKRSGGANSWAGMALDEKRGLVFVPTGSAAFDFYGADRHGDNLFANSLIALRADNGRRIWHFQFVRHDVWDRDLPSPPVLVTLRRNGRTVDAVVQTTKSGHVFVFERESGRPLYPIEWVKTPPSDVDGEQLAPEQPLPRLPPPFARQIFTEDLVTRRTPEAHAAVLARLRRLRSGPQFTPPSLQGTVIFPGFDGGAEWGGAAWDPETGYLYVNSNEMPWVLRLVDRSRQEGRSASALYARECASCHREDKTGSPPEFPSLVDIGQRRTASELEDIIRRGAGRMPAYGRLGEEAIEALVRWLVRGEDSGLSKGVRRSNDLKYSHDGYNKFLDPEGYPAVAPPWGTLNAIDLNQGRLVWSIPLGEYPELALRGLKNTGTENYGGPVVTAGGLLFIAATNFDNKIRAFDQRNGKLLWEAQLPAAGNATPAVYEAGGRQFIVIAAGGGKSGRGSGGAYIAFALPD